MRRRDTLIAAATFLVMIGLSTLIVVTISDAQRRGERALERQKVEQIEQLAASMDTRLDDLDDAFAGITSLPYELQTGSVADQQILDGLQRQQPTSRTGFLLVDADATITAGTLLIDDGAIGTKLDRPGLTELLANGGASVLPVAPGQTTALPTLAIASAIAATDGTPRGAVVFESEVSAASDFNAEVSTLGGPDTGQVLFVDSLGSVVASSDVDLIGEMIDDPAVRESEPGLSHPGDDILVTADVPSAGWRAVFRQNAEDFEGGLGQRLQIVVLLVVIVGLGVGALSVVVLLNRLRAAREEERRLARINEAREEFIGIVSHELRTPVAGVIGFLQTTLDHWDQLGEDERRDTVARAAVNARRLQTLTRDVLDVSGAEQGTLTYSFGPVDLREEVAASVDVLRDSQPEREVTFSSPIDPVWVSGDGDRLMQVLVNLLNNAVASSPVGTAINVTIERASDEVTVAVVDRGAGLSGDELETVFEKFVRGRTSGVRGSGLGLYLCRAIIDAHGGRIWAETAEGAGGVFRFALPTISAPSGAKTPTGA